MAKFLYLSDGTTLEFTDESTIENLVGVYTSFADVDKIAAKITTENLTGATFDNVIVENVVAGGVSASADGAGNVIAHFTTSSKSAIELIQQQLLDIQEAIAEIVGV